MKKILIIGIGAGHPEYITIQAVNALNKVDVFFILDKGADKEKLVEFRRELCRRYIRGRNYRFLDAESPEWERRSADYRATIAGLNRDKQTLFERLIGDGMEDGECGAFLVWGDPTLYDSTLRILEHLQAKGAFELDYEVIPGISSIQALAARHRVAINAIGRAVLITNGRELAEGFPNNVDSVMVLLNADKALRHADGDLEAYWGAYVGMPEEILVSGKLRDIVDEIERVRSAARSENGWIMDCVLLKRPRGGED